MEWFKKQKKWISIIIFFSRVKILLAGTQAQWDESGRRLLLGDNAGGGGGHATADQIPVYCHLNLNLLLLCAHKIDRVYFQIWMSPDIPEHNSYVNCRPRRAVLCPTLWSTHCLNFAFILHVQRMTINQIYKEKETLRCMSVLIKMWALQLFHNI
jgi:hypothetical protein